MTIDHHDIKNALGDHGHLHLLMDSGREFGISLGDTEVKHGTIVIDSVEGKWALAAENVEEIDYEPSGPVAGGE